MSAREVVDFVVAGAGIAGLRAAVELSQAGRVLVLTKEKLGESNTQYAQGGIAVALSGEEDVDLHFADTVQAGDGLVNPAAARILVEEGPARVEELLSWGTNFDRKNGRLMMTREGAHSRSRILHANGDATGREIGRALLEHARHDPHIELREYAFSLDLLVDDGEVRGLTVLDRNGQLVEILSRAVLLATGGAGQVFSETTNPSVATGDGIAMAWRAGAEIADMEFYQFHPTALSLPGAPRFLLSEALRGEGAYLLNSSRERFMGRYHPLLELAPRDVVARAIAHEAAGRAGHEAGCVFLDMRHVKSINPVDRFPGISAFLRRWNLDLSRDLIPVLPAAHYLMGGIRTDLKGLSSLPRLYAAGEAACTGVHGANRLASNSLLEGLVFGARAARSMREESFVDPPSAHPHPLGRAQAPGVGRAQSPGEAHQAARIKGLMWQNAGLLRDGERLQQAAADLAMMAPQLPSGLDRSAIELHSLHDVASAIVKAAIARTESRGAHFRTDFPDRDDTRFLKHSVLCRDQLRFSNFNLETNALADPIPEAIATRQSQ